jgi:hypothetical protein
MPREHSVPNTDANYYPYPRQVPIREYADGSLSPESNSIEGDADAIQRQYANAKFADREGGPGSVRFEDSTPIAGQYTAGEFPHRGAAAASARNEDGSPSQIHYTGREHATRGAMADGGRTEGYAPRDYFVREVTHRHLAAPDASVADYASPFSTLSNARESRESSPWAENSFEQVRFSSSVLARQVPEMLSPLKTNIQSSFCATCE